MKNFKLYGYVILENYFTAIKIIDYLKEVNAQFLLKQLALFKSQKNNMIISYGRKVHTLK